MFKNAYFVLLALYGVTICYCQTAEADSTVDPSNLSTVAPTEVSSSTVVSSTEKPENVSCSSYHGNCEACVKHKVCYYCQSDDNCNKYPVKEIIPSEECNVKDIRYLTCSISFKVLIILAGTLAGIVVLVIICVCCYCCCKKKGYKLSKDQIKFSRQREERKARAEERKKERATRTDEIRRKYGLMKDDNPYERFDEK